MACSHDGCNCNQDSGKTSAGFAVGVAVGAAAVALTDPKTRKKAQRKLDQLTGGKAPAEFLDSIKEVVAQVTEDIRGDGPPKRKTARKRTTKQK